MCGGVETFSPSVWRETDSSTGKERRERLKRNDGEREKQPKQEAVKVTVCLLQMDDIEQSNSQIKTTHKRQ